MSVFGLETNASGYERKDSWGGGPTVEMKRILDNEAQLSAELIARGRLFTIESERLVGQDYAKQRACFAVSSYRGTV
jgi:hypothetical protein